MDEPKFKIGDKVKIVLSGDLGFVAGYYVNADGRQYNVSHMNKQTGSNMTTYFRDFELTWPDNPPAVGTV